jgi:hypothetical protein
VDVRAFIAEMAKALAWPAAVVLIALIFKRTIRGLLEGVRLRQIKKGEWSADFETAAREVRAELPGFPQRVPLPDETWGLDAKTAHLADADPTAAIAQEWNKLEGRVNAIAAQEGIQQQSFPEVLRALVEKGAVQSATTDAILGLRNMRNLAVHAPPDKLTAGQALEFIMMADATTWSLEQNLKKAKAPKHDLGA